MASGDLLCQWEPYAGVPAATGPQQGKRNNQDTLDFDAALDEAADFHGVLPPWYSGGSVVVKPNSIAASATSGNFQWTSAFERSAVGGQDIDSDGHATAVSGTATATSGTSGVKTQMSITHTSGAQMDSAVAGDPFRLRLMRPGSSDANDTMAGDNQLTELLLYEA